MAEMNRIQAVLDASFWINAVRMNLVHYLTDYFDLCAPPRVVDELMALQYLPHPPRSTTLFQELLQRRLIETKSSTQTFGRFDVGENEAIALAREHGWVLLIDNSAPRDWSRGRLQLRVVDSPAF